MWIQSRIPSPSAEAETASSKSRAVVRVDGEGVERGQVAALGLDRLRVGRSRRAASSSIACSKPRSPKRSQISAAATSRGAFGIADLGDHARRGCRGARRRSARRREPGRRRRSRPAARRARTAARRPGSGRGARPPRRTGVTAAPAAALRRAPRGRGRAPSSAPSVSGSSATRTSGFTPSPRIERAVGGQVLADRQVERAAVGQVDHLLEGALAVGAGADHRRRGRSAAAPRSGSRRPRRCRG